MDIPRPYVPPEQQPSPEATVPPQIVVEERRMIVRDEMVDEERRITLSENTVDIAYCPDLLRSPGDVMESELANTLQSANAVVLAAPNNMHPSVRPMVALGYRITVNNPDLALPSKEFHDFMRDGVGVPSHDAVVTALARITNDGRIAASDELKTGDALNEHIRSLAAITYDQEIPSKKDIQIIGPANTPQDYPERKAVVNAYDKFAQGVTEVVSPEESQRALARYLDAKQHWGNIVKHNTQVGINRIAETPGAGKVCVILDPTMMPLIDHISKPINEQHSTGLRTALMANLDPVDQLAARRASDLPITDFQQQRAVLYSHLATHMPDEHKHLAAIIAGKFDNHATAEILRTIGHNRQKPLAEIAQGKMQHETLHDRAQKILINAIVIHHPDLADTLGMRAPNMGSTRVAPPLPFTRAERQQFWQEGLQNPKELAKDVGRTVIQAVNGIVKRGQGPGDTPPSPGRTLPPPPHPTGPDHDLGAAKSPGQTTEQVRGAGIVDNTALIPELMPMSQQKTKENTSGRQAPHTSRAKKDDHGNEVVQRVPRKDVDMLTWGTGGASTRSKGHRSSSPSPTPKGPSRGR